MKNYVLLTLLLALTGIAGSETSFARTETLLKCKSPQNAKSQARFIRYNGQILLLYVNAARRTKLRFVCHKTNGGSFFPNNSPWKSVVFCKQKFELSHDPFGKLNFNGELKRHNNSFALVVNKVVPNTTPPKGDGFPDPDKKIPVDKLICQK